MNVTNSRYYAVIYEIFPSLFSGQDSIPWSRLGRLHLTGVRLVCNCQLAWLAGSSDVIGATCSQPPQGWKLKIRFLYSYPF